MTTSTSFSHRNFFLLGALSVLVLATLACTIPLGGPAAPPDSATPSPEALESFHQKWASVPDNLADNQFTLILTADEVTSAINAGLINSPVQRNMGLTNTYVTLDDGLLLYADSQSGPITASGTVTLIPSVTDDGELAMTPAAADFGRATFEDSQLQELAVSVAAALGNPASGLPVRLRLSSVTVVDGELVLTGSVAG